MINIDFDALSERDIFEAECKEYISGLKVEIDGKAYIVNICSIYRINQEFQMEMEYYGYYVTEPNLIIVDEVTPEKIKLALESNYKNRYFDKIGALNEVK